MKPEVGGPWTLAMVWIGLLALLGPGRVLTLAAATPMDAGGAGQLAALSASEPPPLWSQPDYIVPVVAHAPGRAGSNWASDVVIHNPSGQPVEANLYFLKKGLNNVSLVGKSVSVPASSSVKLVDVVQSVFGETDASGALGIAALHRLVVTSRTYNTSSAGTFGQYIGGSARDTATSGDHARLISSDEQVRLIQLTRSPEYRTNIGFANASRVQATIHVGLYRADGTSLGSRDINLWPYGYAQDNDVFGKVGAVVVEDGYAVVSSQTEGVEYCTYASVIDNRTNDPMTVVPVARTSSAASNRGWSGPVAEAQGSVGEAHLPLDREFPGQRPDAASDAGWVKTANIDGTVWTLAISPTSPPTVYAGTSSGLYWSTDGGGSWTPASPGPTESPLSVLAVDPTTPRTVFAAALGPPISPFGDQYTQVFKSTDGGGSWTGLPVTDHNLEAFAVASSSPSTVYATLSGCDHHGFYCWARFARSADGGTSWSTTDGGNDGPGNGLLAVSPSDPDVVYTTAASVLRTADGGRSWSPAGAGLPSSTIAALAIAPSSSVVLYAATGRGIFKTTNEGASWFTVSTGLAGPGAHALAIDPRDPDTVYAASNDGGLYRTTDGGASWFIANQGLPSSGAGKLTIDPASPWTVYAGTSEGVFRREFRGDLPCDYALTTTSAAVPASGGLGSVTVRTWAECPWAATVDAPWLSISSGASGQGDGVVGWTAAANQTSGYRSGTVTIAGRPFTVTQAGSSCSDPPAPTLTAPATAISAASYELHWTATVPDGTYELQESLTPTFEGASARAVTGTSSSTSHLSGTPTGWYARVRATSACGGATYRSAWSEPSRTTVNPEASIYPLIYLPAAAHTDGIAGTHWRTDLEVHNPGTVPARFIVSVLKENKVTSTPLASAFALEAGRSVRFVDVMGSAGAGVAYSGNAALRISPTAGSVVATQRTYNDQPTGTFGQLIPGNGGRIIWWGSDARLVQLSQSADPTTGFRTNLGFVNTGQTAVRVDVKLFQGDGTFLGMVPVELGSFEFKQISRIFTLVTSEEVADGFAVLSAPDEWGEGCYAYASVIDNRSGDPTYMPAQ